MAAVDQLTGLMSLIQGIQGGESTTKTSGGKQTTQTQLSDNAVQEQIKRILAGSGGVRDIGNSARKSGLYNSTSEDLLLGNLYATAANQGEIARAPVVTTMAPQTSTTQTAGAGLGTTAGLIGGAALLNSIISSDAVGNGVQSLLGSIGLGSGGSPTGVGRKGNELDFGNGTVGFGVGPDSAVGISGSAGSGGWSGDSFGTQAGLGLAGGDPMGQGVGASGNVSKNDGDFDLVGSIGNAVSGFFSGGGLGGLVGAITGGNVGGSGGGGSGGFSGGSVICTALKNRGLLDKELHAKGSKYLETMHPCSVAGYQYWATSIAAKIDKGHKGWTRLCLPVARSRTSLLATTGTFIDHVKHPLGTITKFIGEPICFVIGVKISDVKFIKLFKQGA